MSNPTSGWPIPHLITIKYKWPRGLNLYSLISYSLGSVFSAKINLPKIEEAAERRGKDTPNLDPSGDDESRSGRSITDNVRGILAPFEALRLFALYGQTPLHFIISNRDEESLEMLMNHPGIDVNQFSSSGRAPVHLAIEQGFASDLQTLLAHPNINVNIETISNDASQFDNFYAMREKVSRDNFDFLVSSIITLSTFSRIETQEFVAHPSIQGSAFFLGSSLAVIAAQSRRVATRVANVGYSPLHLAIEKGRQQCVQDLLSHIRIDVNRVTAGGRTPLFVAVEKKSSAMVKLLLRHSAVDVNEMANDSRAPLHVAISNEDVECARLLADHPNIDVNKTTTGGNAPLHLAIFAAVCGRFFVKPCVALIGPLLNHPYIDVNNTTNDGSTPLHLAIRNHQVENIKLLVQHPNIAINMIGRGDKSPLHAAAYVDAQNGDVNISCILLAAGADPSIVDNNGITALDLLEKAWIDRRVPPTIRAKMRISLDDAHASVMQPIEHYVQLLRQFDV